MASGIQPDAGQILNSLINSVLVVDDALAIHYANPAAQQLLAQSSRKLFGTPLPELLSYFSLNIDLMRESLAAGQGFTDNEVTLVIDSRSHILSLTAQRLPDDFILLEMAPMDNQRRLSQEQLQHAQQIAARDLVRGLAHEIKNPLGGLRGAAQLLSKALPDPALTEYTKVIIEQADRLRNLVDRLLGRSTRECTLPRAYIKSQSAWWRWCRWNCRIMSGLSAITTPVCQNCRTIRNKLSKYC